ncbi:hypothetical protein niasHT_029247 [Heterodera trifolii]|uniref:BED-type domain-containing protein n=1 Tax=Heterodera trifolii TaxID=157864 RepID=A0ABD2KFR7_9BILA
MSEIWKFFNKNLTDGAICKLCGKRTARTDGSTKGMWKHLEFKHKHEFSQLKNKENLSQKDGEKSTFGSHPNRLEVCHYRRQFQGLLSLTQTSRIQLQLATYKVLGRTQIDCDIFNWWNVLARNFLIYFSWHELPTQFRPHQCHPNDLSGDMAEQILLIKGNLGHLYLAPSTEPDEDDEELLNFDELEIIED